MIDPIGVGLLLVALVAFVWLASRAWRSTVTWVRWTGGLLCTALSLVLTAAVILTASGYWKLLRPHPNPIPDTTIIASPDQLERGEQLAQMCAGCHAADGELPLEGNDFLTGGDAPPVGRLYAPNLTPTHLGDWSDGEIIRAIREGVGRSGRSLMIMPAQFFRNLSDYDVQSIVAYLRSQPPIEPDTPTPRLNPLGAIMMNFIPVLTVQAPVGSVTSPPPGLTAEYGGYLSSIMCTGCHGSDLRGDPDMGSSDLMATASTWTEDQFLTFFQTGVRPNGDPVDGELMPWKEIGTVYSQEDFRAVHAYLDRARGGS